MSRLDDPEFRRRFRELMEDEELFRLAAQCRGYVQQYFGCVGCGHAFGPHCYFAGFGPGRETGKPGPMCEECL
jgi:hypothetical protein